MLLQACSLVDSPLQALPPFLAGFKTALEEICIPPWHVAEQLPQAPQVCHLQSTEKAQFILTMYGQWAECDSGGQILFRFYLLDVHLPFYILPQPW